MSSVWRAIVISTADAAAGLRPWYDSRVETEVAVVGAAGLAAAAMLRREGVPALVLEAEAEIGAAWQARYDRLHLHTPRRLSGLPGYRIPRAYGRWLPRDRVAAYLQQYARHHRLDVRLSTRVERIERQDGGWLLRTGDDVDTRRTVVATGYSRIPFTPDWPGRDGFVGELIHSADYRNPEPFRGRDVLVVGTGNSGAEIAVDLADGGAARVRVAVRTPPHITRRSSLGIPAQAFGIALGYLPEGWVGPLAAALRRLTIPNLAPFGLPQPPEHLGRQFARTGTIPILDVGFVDAVRSGRIEIVSAVEAFDGVSVLLADGSHPAPDGVIAATGFRAGLEALVGHLDVLDGRGLPRSDEPLPGLHFIGFRPTLGGMLREFSLHAPALARRIAEVSGAAAG
jgi:putative flavoprotein involved in K+ transport